MRLLGRKKAKALAAGTVPAAEVFAEGSSGAEGGASAVSVVAAGTAPVPTTPGAGTADPITSPVPAVAASGHGAPSADGEDAPRLRFGFGEGADAPGIPAGTLASSAPTSWSAPTGAPVTGDGALALAPSKVISIGFGDVEDVETADDVGSTGLPLPGVDPRLRARRIQVRRDEGRKRLRWAVLGGAVLAVLIGAGLVLGSPIFAIDDVEVTGAAYTDPARLQRVVDELDGATLLGADLGKAEAALAADPWVKRVRVERRPLRGVRIEIVERVPVATYVGADQRWRVLDSGGRVVAVLDPPGSKPVDPLELVLAEPGPDLEAGATAPATLTGAASLVPRLPPELRTRTCSLGVDVEGALQLTMCDGFPIQLGPPDRLRDKLVSIVYIMNTLADQVAISSALDVTDPAHPALLPK